jgi:hypothetical protein
MEREEVTAITTTRGTSMESGRSRASIPAYSATPSSSSKEGNAIIQYYHIFSMRLQSGGGRSVPSADGLLDFFVQDEGETA